MGAVDIEKGSTQMWAGAASPHGWSLTNLRKPWEESGDKHKRKLEWCGQPIHQSLMYPYLQLIIITTIKIKVQTKSCAQVVLPPARKGVLSSMGYS